MRARAWIVIGLSGLLACGGTEPPPGPQAGTVVASLNTPNNRDGALVIRIIGEHTGLKASGSYRLDTGTGIPGTTVKAIISGTIVDGDLLEFRVTDISKLPTLVVVVEQAAARDTYALLDASGYNITLRVK